MWLLWVSKSVRYENPYSVTGTIKITGLKGKPKDICKDNIFGTLKTGNFEILLSMKWF